MVKLSGEKVDESSLKILPVGHLVCLPQLGILQLSLLFLMRCEVSGGAGFYFRRESKEYELILIHLVLEQVDSTSSLCMVIDIGPINLLLTINLLPLLLH